MERIKQISDLVQLALTELGSIAIALIGLLGIVKLLIQHFKELRK